MTAKTIAGALGILMLACTPSQRSYRGALAEKATSERARAAEWNCQEEYNLPGMNGAPPFRLCSSVNERHITIVTDTSELVVAIYESWDNLTTKDGEERFAQARDSVSRVRGSGEYWCDPGSLADTRYWNGDGVYYILTRDTTVAKVALQEVLGKPPCASSRS